MATQGTAATGIPQYPGSAPASVPQSYAPLYTQPGYFSPSAPGGRASMAGWRAYDAALLKTGEGKLANIGPIEITLTAVTNVIFNSNVNQSQNSPVAAVGFNPSINLATHWVLTPRNELDFNIGFSVTYYPGKPQYNQNSLGLSPGTVLKYSIYTGDFVFTLYDTPSISNTPSSGQGTGNIINFSQLGNQLGLLGLWDLNKMTLTASLQESATQTLNGQFGSQNSTQYSLNGGGFYQLTPTLSFGAKGSVALSDYAQNVLNNYTQYSAGLVAQNRFSLYTTVYAELGAQYFDFANNGTQGTNGPVFTRSGGNITNVTATGGGGNSFTPYLNLGITNHLNRYYTQSLTFSYSTGASGISNTFTETSISYNGSWRMNRYLTLNGSLTAMNNTFSGEGTGSSNQLQALLGFSYFLNRQLPLTFSYSYTDQVGSGSVGSYVQGLFTMGVTYSF